MIMPYQRNPYFTGRDALLDELYVRLCETNPNQYAHRIALFGLGGVGKTQTAIEYIYRNERFYQRIYWVSAVDEASVLSGFQQIAKSTRCVHHMAHLKPAEVANQVLLWLRRQASWLLVFDNLDDVSIVKDYLPDIGSDGHTLITTRNPNTLSIPAEGLEVGFLEIQSASELLLKRSGVQIDSKAEDEALKIVTELRFLPLAIVQAAAYIREAWKDITTFLSIYQLHRKHLNTRKPTGNWDYERSVATTWLLAFDAIEIENPRATKLLQLFAFLSPDPILIEFLQAGIHGLPNELREIVASPLLFQEALFVLERFSLIKRCQEGVFIHRLVQAVIKDILAENDERTVNEVWNATIALCQSAFSETYIESRDLCSRFRGQFTVLLSSPPSSNSTTLGNILCQIGSFLERDGKYINAEAFHLKAVLVFSSVLEKSDSMLLHAIHQLQRTYHANGKFEDAVKLGEENLKTRITVLGQGHSDTLESMESLAWIYQDQGRLDDALKLHEQALELSERLLGMNHL